MSEGRQEKRSRNKFRGKSAECGNLRKRWLDCRIVGHWEVKVKVKKLENTLSAPEKMNLP